LEDNGYDTSKMGLKDTVTDREAQVLAHSPSPTGDVRGEEKGEKDLVR
jgi:hypothetical protein